MSGRKTTSWNPQVHEDILVALLTVAKITPQQLSEAMKALTAQGYTFTESALKCVLPTGSRPYFSATPSFPMGRFCFQF
ncbi:hypothetical protein ACHAQH_009096 [Verticillium albo-atrum]